MGEETEFGFTADASDVLAILDYEFAQRGVAPSERVAVLPAHSRGQLVAIKFKATYQQHFKKVVVIGLDGVEECEAIQESFEDDLVETTGVEFPTGFVRRHAPRLRSHSFAQDPHRGTTPAPACAESCALCAPHDA